MTKSSSRVKKKNNLIDLYVNESLTFLVENDDCGWSGIILELENAFSFTFLKQIFFRRDFDFCDVEQRAID